MKRKIKRIFLTIVTFSMVVTIFASNFKADASEVENKDENVLGRMTTGEESATGEAISPEKPTEEKTETIDEETSTKSSADSVSRHTKEEVEDGSITPPAKINQLFTDPNLAEVIRVQLKKTSTEDIVTKSELESIISLDLYKKNIKNINGLEYLTNLVNCQMANNQITSLNPLKNLMQLKGIDISNNASLSDLTPLEDLNQLSYLGANAIGVSNIEPLTNLINLEYVNLGSNQIEDISALKSLTKLQTLHLSENNIEDISILKSLTKIDVLYLFTNKIKDISALSHLNNLNYVALADNQIADVTPLSGLSQLITVYLQNNRISDISSLSSLGETYIDASDQVIYNPLERYNEGNVSIPNTIVGTNGMKVSPSYISDNGVYNGSNVEWKLPYYQSKVSYDFLENLNDRVAFSGTVNQPLDNSINNAYYVTFQNGKKTDTISVSEQQLIPEPSPEPTQEGYTFKGWYDAETNGEKWDFETDKMPARDITLYAQFTKESINPPTNGNGSPSIPDKTNPGEKDILVKTIKPLKNPQQAQEKHALPKTGDSYPIDHILLGIFFLGVAVILTRWNRINS
ncbi:TPA_asm: internalin [Listeria monocytogenes]|nr:internalin [Listeria monocytogenes]